MITKHRASFDTAKALSDGTLHPVRAEFSGYLKIAERLFGLYSPAAAGGP